MSANPSPTAVILALEVSKVATRKTTSLNVGESKTPADKVSGGRRFKDVLHERSTQRNNANLESHPKGHVKAKGKVKPTDGANNNHERNNAVDKDNKQTIEDNENGKTATTAHQRPMSDDTQTAAHKKTADNDDTSDSSVEEPSVTEEPQSIIVEVPTGEEWHIATADLATEGLPGTAESPPQIAGGNELPLATTLAENESSEQLSSAKPELSATVVATGTQQPATLAALEKPESTGALATSLKDNIETTETAIDITMAVDTVTESADADFVEKAAPQPTTPIEISSMELETKATKKVSSNDAATAAISPAISIDAIQSRDGGTQSASTTQPGLFNHNATQTNQPATAHNSPVVASETLELLKEARSDINIVQPSLSATASSATDETANVKPAGLQTHAPAVEAKWAQSLGQLQSSGLGARPVAMQTPVPFNASNGQWFNAIAERVMWLASQNIQAAELHLDPPELGPMQVRVAVNHDQASVNFISHHVAVRDILDLNVNRLRDMFANEGMNLVNVDVSDRSLQQQSRDQGHEANPAGTDAASNQGDADHSGPLPAAVKITHLVDHYI